MHSKDDMINFPVFPFASFVFIVVSVLLSDFLVGSFLIGKIDFLTLVVMKMMMMKMMAVFGGFRSSGCLLGLLFTLLLFHFKVAPQKSSAAEVLCVGELGDDAFGNLATGCVTR
jgi:hypothetical protein